MGKKKGARPLIQPPFSLYNDGIDASSSSSTVSATSDGLAENKKKDVEPKTKKTFSDGLQGVARLLQGRKNIVVLVGAGISVSCGIPDFRSQGSGLYSTLDIEALGLSCPEELFDWEFFQEDPAPFFKFARNLYFPLDKDRTDSHKRRRKRRVEPSDSHKILALLEQQSRLLRVYTQNIDSLETKAGVSSRKMVYAHGSLEWAKCCKCQRRVNSEDILPIIEQGLVPRCQAVMKRSGSPSPVKSSAKVRASRSSSSSSSCLSTAPCQTRKRRRATSSSSCADPEGDGERLHSKRQLHPVPSSPSMCNGVLKPAVTFFGESLNDSVRRSLEADKKKVDALIVIGTSLSVAPISKVIEYLPSNIPRILINRTLVHPNSTGSSGDSVPTANDDGVDEDFGNFRTDYVFDAYLLGFCDDVTRAMAKELFKDANHTENAGNTGCGGDRRESVSTPECGGKLLSSLLEGDDEGDENDFFNVEDWRTSVTVPPERVLLFPGAMPTTSGKDTGGDDDGEVTYREIAHCDGCSKRIYGTIQKCVMCFDYDLCPACFPILSKTHYDGKHTFSCEPAAP